MYLDYFGLAERPFSIAPDPHYLYMSARHKEAMAHLTYGLSQGGCFIVLTGEVGTGKTTLCRNLLSDLPEDIEVALILNANINEQELLQTVCDELKITYQDSNSQKQLLDNINAHLLAGFASNRQTVLIIDEAQLLSRDVLEQVRLLTNLETTKSKLLQIILIGQPELNDVLCRNDLRQLAQRVTARYHLGPLEKSEIEDYVNFRLSVAGCRKPLFTKQGLNQLHRSTEGIPRRINVLADHALLSAYSKTQAVVDAKMVKAATKEVFIQSDKPRANRVMRHKWSVVIACIVMANALLWWWFLSRTNNEPMLDAVPLAAQVSTSISADIGSGVPHADSDKPNNVAVNETPNIETAPNGVTTILRSSDITPGSVVIADAPLDDSELRVQPPSPISQPPAREFIYDAKSELGRALEASSDLTGRIAAFRALAAAWDVDLSNQLIQPLCDELSDNGVSCLGVSSWAQLLRFDRPTILVLDQNNNAHRVIVFKVDGNSAQVLVGQQVLNVSVDELRSRWTNNGILFWRPSVANNTLLRQGDESDHVRSVRGALNQVLSNLAMANLNSVDSRVFDLPLAQSAFALQARYSLVTDSKIGSETYLLMNEVLLTDETPVLRQRVK